MIRCVEEDAGIRDMEVYALTSTGYEAKGFADGTVLRLSQRKPITYQQSKIDIRLPCFAPNSDLTANIKLRT